MKYYVGIEAELFEVEILDNQNLSVNGEVFHFDAQPGSRPEHFSLIVNGQSHQAWIERIKPTNSSTQTQLRVHLQGYDFEVLCEDERSHQLRQLIDSESGEQEEGRLIAPMPGLVLQILIEPGQQVSKGDGIFIVEAMKMENEIRSPLKGEIKEIRVKARQTVEKGEILAVIG